MISFVTQIALFLGAVFGVVPSSDLLSRHVLLYDRFSMSRDDDDLGCQWVVDIS